jgi:hypothetical protein
VVYANNTITRCNKIDIQLNAIEKRTDGHKCGRFLLVFIMPKVKNKKISNLTTWRSYMILAEKKDIWRNFPSNKYQNYNGT